MTLNESFSQCVYLYLCLCVISQEMTSPSAGLTQAKQLV